MPTPGRSSTGRGPLQCVLLHARAGGGLPADLADSLARRGVSAVPADDEHRAMAEACLLARRGAAGIIIVEPSRFRLAPALADALAVAAPGVSVWAYQESSTPRLAPWRPLRAEPPRPQAAPVVRARGPLRLAGDGPADDAPPARARGSVTLTEAELAMLLSDDWGEPPNGADRAGGGRS